MQDLEEASTALKGHRETLENATSEEEARHHYHNDSRCLNLFFDKHLTPFRMVAPSNAPSPDLRGLTQPQKKSESQTISKIGIVTLGWNAVSKVNISEQEPPTTAEPPDQSLLQVRECLEKVKSCIEKHKNAAQTAKKNIVT